MGPGAGAGSAVGPEGGGVEPVPVPVGGLLSPSGTLPLPELGVPLPGCVEDEAVEVCGPSAAGVDVEEPELPEDPVGLELRTVATDSLCEVPVLWSVLCWTTAPVVVSFLGGGCVSLTGTVVAVAELEAGWLWAA